MKIHNIKQGTPEWHAFRKEGIGASEIAAIMGVCPWRKRIDVAKSKLLDEKVEANAAMKRGSYYEEEARDVFNAMHEHAFEPVCVEHDTVSYFRASLDGYDQSTRSILEIKVPGLDTLEKARNQIIPINYEYQIQWQMMVSGCLKAYYMVYHPESFEHHIIEINADENLWDRMVAAGHQFWQEVQEEAFDFSKPEVLVVEDIEIKKALEGMADAKNREQAAKAEYERCRKIVEEYAGERCLETDVFTYVYTMVNGYNYRKAAIEAGVDLEKYKNEPTKRWSLKVKC